MNEKKSVALQIIIAVAVVLVVIAVGFTFMSGNKSETESSQKPGEVPATTEEVQNLDDVVVGVYKDSVLKSSDGGLNFETYFKIATATNAKIGIADVLSIAFHPEVADRVVVSTYDDGLFLNEKRVNAWKQIPFPPQQIYSFILDKKDPDNRAFASGVVSGNGRIFRTEDEGTAWRAVYAEPGTKTFVSALTQDPRNANLILAGTSVGTVVRSTDGGDTWKNIGQTITGYISDFAHDSTKSSFMYLLVQKGKIYHSYDAGVTWLNWEEEKTKEMKRLNDQASILARAGNKEGATQLRAQASAIQERNKTEKAPSGTLFIVADPNRTGVVYTTASKGLYRSTDYGKYWKPVNIIESAQSFPIPSVAINPDNSDEISFVAGKSFYRSVNGGVTWAIAPLDNTRNASFVAYDPFDTSVIFVGMSAKK
jgi:photosystem II stability/assembly factor-like uncharacterized protein